MSFDKHSPMKPAAALLLALVLLGMCGCGKTESKAPRADSPTTDTAEPDTSEDEVAHLRHPPANPVATLKAALADGTLVHAGDDNAFLAEVLRITGVPEASQVLVFSKTSMQSPLITPQRPRAIYFSDDFYVGYVPGGIIEISDTDPQGGTGFFALNPRSYERDDPLTTPIQCLNCHHSSRTHYAPGLIVRSVYSDGDGFPIDGAGSFVTGHDSPLEERWGGWYVTGRHGSMEHMGNTLATRDGSDAKLDRSAGANITELDEFITPDDYLQSGSDIVALMVLEHQVGMHNLLTQSAIAVTRQTFRSRKVVESTGAEFDPYASETLMSLVQHDAERIVRHLLFVDEFALTDPVRGDRAFLRQFRANRHTAPDGRSLKDTDLNTRLFRYRCSYMVYSQGFASMPELLKEAVYQLMFDALTGPTTELNAHLPVEERTAILEILRETVEDLPAYWRD